MRALMDEQSWAKMSEPPPVYNLKIFRGRRDTANQEKQRNSDCFLQSGCNDSDSRFSKNDCCSLYRLLSAGRRQELYPF